jgi:hypothetical protein
LTGGLVRALAKLVPGCAVVVALTAPSGALPAKAKNACALLTTSQIEKEFGPDVATPTRGPGPACNWEIGTEPGVTGSGTVGTFLLRTQAKVAFAGNRSIDPGVSEIDGLGQDAYYTPMTGTVWVLKNSKTMFSVQGVIVGENVGRDEDATPELEDKLIRLAKKALKQA